MLAVKGTVSTALCYTQWLDAAAEEQIRRMCDQEFTRGSRIRMMPDVQWGKGCVFSGESRLNCGVQGGGAAG